MSGLKPLGLVALLLLSACGGAPDTPGAVTSGEAQALNDAAAMLDANSVDANAMNVEIDGENEAQPQ
ncbi:hypothetical protein G4G27_10790 [Sphingomonas sp. So64.6b]|uniref:hypothetical protein n=1 Tax=Sphingomonas sp. So64.6b TaxID=2997354 RepID=UPI001603F9F3|nr:hypothetical protein [Sphingomonas sp. So64.6b]QNA84422.1 hypothetical protein G4G27_10790 [Sphingomonas sp. So64.6b]